MMVLILQHYSSLIQLYLVGCGCPSSSAGVRQCRAHERSAVSGLQGSQPRRRHPGVCV